MPTKHGMSPLEVRARLELDPRLWLYGLFGHVITSDLAPHHEHFWEWLWQIELGLRPRPYVGIWPRDHGKSTSSELGCTALGVQRKRRYALYVSETQDQADGHVQSISELLSAPKIEMFYPEFADRAVNKYGQTKGWRRDRLTTRGGFVVDALGLDSAARGIKFEEMRPDLIVLDDVDGETDTPATVDKKIKRITHKIIPAGSRGRAVIAVQNLVHADSIFSQLADGRADWLSDRIVSGPIPAVRNLTYEQRGGKFHVTGGKPTWEGMGIAECEAAIADIGISAFLIENQHEVDQLAGGVFDHLDLDSILVEPDDVPELEQVVVWVDPAVTDTDKSDSQGMQADALGVDGHVYRLRSWEQRSSPQETLKLAILWAFELGAEHVGVETDQGGDVWRSAFSEAVREAEAILKLAHPDLEWTPPDFKYAKAGEGHGPKRYRAQQMLQAYERDVFRHVRGTHTTLHRALRRFPLVKPYDLVDAAYYSWIALKGRPKIDRAYSGRSRRNRHRR